MSQTVDVVNNDDLEDAILRLRFGVCDGMQASIADIAKLFGLSRKQVLVAEKRALQRVAPAVQKSTKALTSIVPEPPPNPPHSAAKIRAKSFLDFSKSVNAS